MNEQQRKSLMAGSSFQTVTVAAECFGVPIGVKCRSVEASAVYAHLPAGCTLIDPSEAEYRFVLECRDQNVFSVKRWASAQTSTSQSLNTALKTLQKEIHICVAEHSKTFVFIHAGVVAWKNRVIVFPGSSHAGKSTLVWSLLQAGAVYYSDEYAVFDENGYVHPFALPVALRLQDGGRRMIVPDKVASAPVKPNVIAFARYRPGAIWRPACYYHPLQYYG